MLVLVITGALLVQRYAVDGDRNGLPAFVPRDAEPTGRQQEEHREQQRANAFHNCKYNCSAE